MGGSIIAVSLEADMEERDEHCWPEQPKGKIKSKRTAVVIKKIKQSDTGHPVLLAIYEYTYDTYVCIHHHTWTKENKVDKNKCHFFFNKKERNVLSSKKKKIMISTVSYNI